MTIRYGQPLELKHVIQKIKNFASALDFSRGGSVSLGTENPFTGDFYVTLRVKWNGLNGAFQHLLVKRDSYGVGTMMFDFGLRDTDGDISVDFGTGSAFYTGKKLPKKRWCTVTWVHNSTGEYVYLGRDQIYQRTPALALGTGTTSEIVVGATDTPKVESFNGIINTLVIGTGNPSWKDVAKIASKYQYESDAKSENVFAPWCILEFDEIYGTTAIDKSGNGRNGAIVKAKYTSDVFMKYNSDPDAIRTVLPSGVGHLVAHYKADKEVFSDDGTTAVTNGGRVYRMNDLSGNGNDAKQTDSSLRPQYVTNVLNGYAGLLFSNARQDVLKALDSSSLAIYRKYHIFAVIKPTAIVADNVGVVVKDGVGADSKTGTVISNPEYSVYVNSNGYPTTNATSSANSNMGLGNNLQLTQNTPYLLEGEYTGIRLASFVNGALNISVGVSKDLANTGGDLRIGAQKATFASRSFEGYIMEIAIFRKNLPPTILAGVRKYFAEKYGLTVDYDYA